MRLLVVWETASQMWRETDFKARYKCLGGKCGQNGGTQNAGEASTMNNTATPELKSGYLFGIRMGEKNKNYTLSVDACCSSEAISELKAALAAIEEGRSHFASGDNNVMMIGNVAATLRTKPVTTPATPGHDDQTRQAAESAVPRTVFPLPYLS